MEQEESGSIREGLGCLAKLAFLLSLLMFLGFIKSKLYFDSEVEEAIRRGSQIVLAVKAYHRDQKIYPETLKELIPKYMVEIPETGLSGNEKFNYGRVLEPPVDEDHYGYFITIHLDRFFWFIGDRCWTLYMYHPSERYPSSRYETTHKIVKGWAHQEVCRKYTR